MLFKQHIQAAYAKGLQFIRQVAASRNTSSILNLIGILFLVLAAFAVVVAIVIFLITIVPFLLVWAFNTLAPIFGSALVIPYSLPVLFAIYIVLWVLMIIFKRGGSKRSRNSENDD